MSPEPEHVHGHGAADSAGQPWAGRSFTPNPAAGDDGSADAALIAALNGFRAGTARPEDVVEAFRSARLLIPLLAHAGEIGTAPDGHLVDKTQELSIVTVAAPDGRRVLPAFTSVATMSAWDPQARPVPAAGPRVALAAASEQTELIVIDPTAPTEFVLRRPAVYALATGEPWAAPHSLPGIRHAFERALEAEPDALAVELLAGDPSQRLQAPELTVRLSVRAGLDFDALQALVARLSERWAASPAIAGGVDSLAVQVVRG